MFLSGFELTLMDCLGEKEKTSDDKHTSQESLEINGGNDEVEGVAISGADQNTDQLIINAVRLRPSLWEPCCRKKTPAAIWNFWEKVCEEIGVSHTQRDAVKDRWANFEEEVHKCV